MQELYNQYLAPLERILGNYFSSLSNKYFRIIILADNLDKTWNSNKDLNLPAQLIISLLEMDNKIRNSLMQDNGLTIDIREIIFLRKDIYEYILKNSNEGDKIDIMKHEIDWQNYPERLKEVIDKRFAFILNLSDKDEIESVWKQYFITNKKKNEHIFRRIKNIVTPRPRDMIYFVARLFESAANKGHEKVDEDDFDYAIKSYTSFLNNNLIAERRAEYPEIRDILARLQAYHGTVLKYNKLLKILDEFHYPNNKKESLVKVLFSDGYMVGFDKKTKTAFHDLETLRKKLGERKWLFFKNNVYVIAHAKYYFIKNKVFTSF